MSTEAFNQQRSKLVHVNLTGGVIYRNNSGAFTDQDGRLIRFGLGNDSEKTNKQYKSSDLIGITPEVAFIPRFGWVTIGVFTALEIKPSDWKLQPGDKRGLAQSNFHDIVRSVGGYAGFVTNPERDIPIIIGRPDV